MLLKALLWVVEAKAETAGRTRAEEKIVKSITEVMTRIDAGKGRQDGEGRTGRWGSRQCLHLLHPHGKRALEGEVLLKFPFQDDFESEVWKPLHPAENSYPCD
jgi:hypothetical protein